VRVGTIKKAVATAGNISIKNKLGRPLKKKNRTPPVEGYFCTQKTISKKEARNLLAP
jgi:hypothetical protein